MKTKRKNPQMKELTYEQVESRKDRGVEGLRRMGESSRADTLDDESVEDFAERKNITIVNPRAGKKNPRFFGRTMTQHQARKYARDNNLPFADWMLTPKEHERARKRQKQWASDARADRREFKKKQAAERKEKVIEMPKRNPKRGRRRNGEIEDAQAMFKKFHGRKSTTIEEVRARQHYRRTMSGLGVLMFLRTDLTQEWNGKGVGLTFSEEDKVIVASDPAGNQLYFLGGNQDVTGILPKGLAQKDFIDLGECDHIIYTADKDFDNFEEKDYQHEFGEETGERPRLMFDRLNQQLYLIGGHYEVKREGIVN